MSDLIERLYEAWFDKSRASFDCANCGIEANLVQDAADEIERLQARVDVLEAALLVVIDRGILSMYELGREAYRIKRKTERKLANARAAAEQEAGADDVT